MENDQKENNSCLEEVALVCQEWDESERGWGMRPDGISLHLTEQDCRDYIKEYWARMPDTVPDEYSLPSGSPYIVQAPISLYGKIKASKNGIKYSGMRIIEKRKIELLA